MQSVSSSGMHQVRGRKIRRAMGGRIWVTGNNWLGGLDSNQDSQSQSLESYQLDDLPAGRNKKESRRVRLSRRLRFNLSNLIGNAKSVNRHGNDYSLATMNGRTSDVQLAKKTDSSRKSRAMARNTSLRW